MVWVQLRPTEIERMGSGGDVVEGEVEVAGVVEVTGVAMINDCNGNAIAWRCDHLTSSI